jgi:hypothetical protein
MSILSRLFGSAKHDARSEAVRLGISVDEVTRGCPFFNFNNSKVSVEPELCIKYTVQRQPGKEPAEWSFLQRTRHEGAQYAHGYLFTSVAGSPSLPLERLLTAIAEEWDGEHLEFEATPSEVSAFWAEFGGEGMVRKIYGYLQALAQA